MWKRIDRGISISEKHSGVDVTSLAVWYLVLPHTDLAGRYSGNHRLIKAQCLPLFNISEESVRTSLIVLSEAGLIHSYQIDGTPFIVYHDADDWNPSSGLKHGKPKFPCPEEGAFVCECLKVQREIEEKRRSYNLCKGKSYNLCNGVSNGVSNADSLSHSHSHSSTDKLTTKNVSVGSEGENQVDDHVPRPQSGGIHFKLAQTYKAITKGPGHIGNAAERFESALQYLKAEKIEAALYAKECAGRDAWQIVYFAEHGCMPRPGGKKNQKDDKPIGQLPMRMD